MVMESKQKIKKADDLFVELAILWSLHTLGGEATHEDLKAETEKTYNFIVKEKLDMLDVASMMIEEGIDKEKICKWFEMNGLINL